MNTLKRIPDRWAGEEKEEEASSSVTIDDLHNDVLRHLLKVMARTDYKTCKNFIEAYPRLRYEQESLHLALRMRLKSIGVPIQYLPNSSSIDDLEGLLRDARRLAYVTSHMLDRTSKCIRIKVPGIDHVLYSQNVHGMRNLNINPIQWDTIVKASWMSPYPSIPRSDVEDDALLDAGCSPWTIPYPSLTRSDLEDDALLNACCSTPAIPFTVNDDPNAPIGYNLNIMALPYINTSFLVRPDVLLIDLFPIIFIPQWLIDMKPQCVELTAGRVTFCDGTELLERKFIVGLRELLADTTSAHLREYDIHIRHSPDLSQYTLDCMPRTLTRLSINTPIPASDANVKLIESFTQLESFSGMEPDPRRVHSDHIDVLHHVDYNRFRHLTRFHLSLWSCEAIELALQRIATLPALEMLDIMYTHSDTRTPDTMPKTDLRFAAGPRLRRLVLHDIDVRDAAAEFIETARSLRVFSAQAHTLIEGYVQAIRLPEVMANARRALTGHTEGAIEQHHEHLVLMNLYGESWIRPGHNGTHDLWYLL